MITATVGVGQYRRRRAAMDNGGWGGFSMHTRVGSRTPYLGPRWMDCIRAYVDKAREQARVPGLTVRTGGPAVVRAG
jgi:hypothetical protein